MEEAVGRHITIQTGKSQAQSARAKDMHARRAAAAGTPSTHDIQSGEGSDSEGSGIEGEDSDGGSDDGGDAMMTDMVGYLLGA